MYAENRELDSRGGIIPDFFYLGLCRAFVDLCCVSLIVKFWLGIMFLLSKFIRNCWECGNKYEHFPTNYFKVIINLIISNNSMVENIRL